MQRLVVKLSIAVLIPALALVPVHADWREVAVAGHMMAENAVRRAVLVCLCRRSVFLVQGVEQVGCRAEERGGRLGRLPHVADGVLA